MKSITTIIPAYNAAATLNRTLRSALAQTYSRHEILIINDGSTDATQDIAKSYAAMHSNICIVSQDNRGLSGARNRGIDEASGAYIAPLDADDLWHPEKLSRLVAALEAMPDAGLAYGWFRRIDEADCVLPNSASPRVEGWVFHQHLARNFISNGSSPVIRTDVARAVRYDENFNSCEDYLFQLLVARKYQFAHVPAYLTGYRLNRNSMSRNVARMIQAHLKMFRLIRPGLGGSAQRIVDRRIAGLEVELARNRIRRRAFGEAGRALRRAVNTDPVAALAGIRTEVATAVTRGRRPMFAQALAAFDHFSPEQTDGEWSDPYGAYEARLAALDAKGPDGF